MHNSTDKNTHNIIWNFPWKFIESFCIATGLLIIGFALEYIHPKNNIAILYYPYNLFAGSIFISILILIFYFYRKKPLVKWLSSIPASISAISLLTFLVLLMGLTPQND